MKVCIATQFPVEPSQPRGGVEAVSVSLVRHLARVDGVVVDVVTTRPGQARLEKVEWEGATVHHLPWAGGRTLSHACGRGRRQVQEYLRELRPEVVHAHDTYGLMTRGLALPRVFTIHGFIHADTRIAGGRLCRLRSWLWRRAERACWADQPHIISISPYVRERLRGIARGVIHDIDNPIAEECFDVPRQDTGGVIFSAASICPRKNPIGLVEALASVVASGVDARLRLAGTADEAAYEEKLRQAVRTHSLEGRVTMLGHLSAEQVRQELSGASVFALVSLEENSPMGIEEAMAAGVPVVTSNRCGMPYMVRDGESGFLVDPEDTKDVARGLREVFADVDRLAAMGRKGREIALDRFDPKRVAERTLRVYRRALAGGGPSAWDDHRV